MWISNSPIADVFVVWAKEVSEGGQVGPIRGFVLEKGMKGLGPGHPRQGGLRASITGEIVMDGPFVPEENAFPGSEGLKGPFTCLNSARYGIAWGLWVQPKTAGTPCAPVHDGPQAVRPSPGRQPAHPEKLADMQTEIAAGLQGCLRLGRMKDEARLPWRSRPSIKRNSCGKAGHCAHGRAT